MLAAGSVRLITSNLFVLTNLRASDSVGDPNEQPHRVVNRSLFVAKSCMAHSNFFCRMCVRNRGRRHKRKLVIEREQAGRIRECPVSKVSPAISETLLHCAPLPK